MPEIVLIRGLPGSGKTTMAKNLYPDHILCEADQYRERYGSYVFDPRENIRAHAWCQEKAADELAKGNNVVVANTFIKRWEMDPYFSLGYPVTVMEAKGEYENTHGVSSEVVEKMRQKYEPYP